MWKMIKPRALKKNPLVMVVVYFLCIDLFQSSEKDEHMQANNKMPFVKITRKHSESLKQIKYWNDSHVSESLRLWGDQSSDSSHIQTMCTQCMSTFP